MYDYCSTLEVERRGNGVLVLTFNVPPSNAFTSSLHHDLKRVLEDVNRDDGTKVIVVTGAGDRTFSAGGDMAQMRHLLDHPSEIAGSFQEARSLLLALLRLERPIIARINGHAIGLGATLALFCDLTYAVASAKIGDPHVAVGLAAGDGGALIWPQLIGYARARECLLTGDPILAPEAAAIGLINQAVPRNELDSRVYGMADRLASGATIAINLTKQAINLPLRRLAEQMIDAHVDYEMISAFSEDHREAVAAFVEKRPHQFNGR